MTTRMPFGSRIAALTAFALAGATLAACGSGSTTETAIETVSPEPQITLASPPAPTTTGLPTEAPTPAPTPKPVLGPEQPAVSIDHVTGSWLVRFFGDDTGLLTFNRDGTYNSVITSGDDAGMVVEEGTYGFEDDVLALTTDWCPSVSGEAYTCTAKYRVFVAMADDNPGSLRFVLIEDPVADRKGWLSDKTLLRAPEE